MNQIVGSNPHFNFFSNFSKTNSIPHENSKNKFNINFTDFLKTMSCMRAIDANITVAHMRSKRNVGSGCDRYIVSLALFRYHMVTG